MHPFKLISESYMKDHVSSALQSAHFMIGSMGWQKTCVRRFISRVRARQAQCATTIPTASRGHGRFTIDATELKELRLGSCIFCGPSQYDLYGIGVQSSRWYYRNPLSDSLDCPSMSPHWDVLRPPPIHRMATLALRVIFDRRMIIPNGPGYMICSKAMLGGLVGKAPARFPCPRQATACGGAARDNELSNAHAGLDDHFRLASSRTNRLKQSRWYVVVESSIEVGGRCLIFQPTAMTCACAMGRPPRVVICLIDGAIVRRYLVAVHCKERSSDWRVDQVYNIAHRILVFMHPVGVLNSFGNLI